jgi:hypothetical protein
VQPISAKASNAMWMVSMMIKVYLLQPDPAARAHWIFVLEVATALGEEWHAVPLCHVALCVRPFPVEADCLHPSRGMRRGHQSVGDDDCPITQGRVYRTAAGI